MVLSDITGMGRIIEKLLDVLQNGFGAIVSPWQIKRIAKAEAAALITKADADRLNRFKDAIFGDVINNVRSIREKRELSNLGDIFYNAAIELSSYKTISDEAINPDWCARFVDYAKDISDEEAKIIWSKLLAGELREPGKYKKRTMNVLRNLESDEASNFLKLCGYVVDGSIFLDFMPNEMLGTPLTSSIDCGLLNPSMLAWTIKDFDEPITIIGKTLSISCNINSAEKIIVDYDVLQLSEAGMQLFPLVTVNSDRHYFEQLCSSISNHKGIETEVLMHESD